VISRNAGGTPLATERHCIVHWADGGPTDTTNLGRAR
jgi:hypothetical protein